MSYKKIIAIYLDVVKASLPLLSFSLDHDTSTFSIFTLLTSTLSHILINYTHIIKKGEIYQKPKSLVVWGRGDLTFLFKSCEIDKSQGRLV